jgi:DNA-binding MarR family transcriptional regulator
MGELESRAFEMEGFSDITMNQMLYLETIARLEEPTFGDLADHLGVTRPSVSVIVKKLVETGYIHKVQSDLDGRVYHLHLTEKGNRFNELHSEVHQILAHRITENLDQDEIEALAVLLEKIALQ